MSDHNPVKPLSISELFQKNYSYIIPIYQRNYAWGKVEIEQLLTDICDAAGINIHGNTEANTKQDNYYLGSLVVDYRGKKSTSSKHKYETHEYETIDGQQRHTTLSILLAYLKRELRDESVEGLRKLEVNLTFDSRPKSKLALESLFELQDKRNLNHAEAEPTIQAAYNIIERFFKSKEMAQGTLSKFANYLLNNVIILRVEVPEQTDLNHYFEIMNNRGEQLEKHEVLKARLMEVLNTDEQHCFSVIWDVCSDMNRFTQMGFESTLRTKLFGGDEQLIPLDFDEIKGSFDEVKASKKQQSNQDASQIDANEVSSTVSNSGSQFLCEIIKEKGYKNDRNKEAKTSEDKFGSIIDFPNFLLHVLKMMPQFEDVSLDDKKLLKLFPQKSGVSQSDTDSKTQMKLDAKFAKNFVCELLKWRGLFDRYIIKPNKTTQEHRWLLKKPNSNNTFGQDSHSDDESGVSLNNKIRMILAMFHVTYPSNAYKRWLHDVFKMIDRLIQGSIEIDGADYLDHLEKLSDEEFLRIKANSKLQYAEDKKADEQGVLHRGTGVQNFIFNRLEYLLWRRLKSGESFGGEDQDKIKAKVNSFEFAVGRNSVEHYFPQTNPSGTSAAELGMDSVDRFGNLCLISPSSNSRLSNYYPQGKKSFYQDNDRTESLKQTLMMSYPLAWGPELSINKEFGNQNIIHHEKEMLAVLQAPLGTKIARENPPQSNLDN